MLTNLNHQPEDYKQELISTQPDDYETVRRLCLHSNPNLPYCNQENASIVDEKLASIDFKRYVPRLVNDINFAIAWKLRQYEPEVVKRFVNNESGIEALDFDLRPETILKYLSFVPPITDQNESLKILQKAYPLARLHCNHTEIISTILSTLNPQYSQITDFLLDQLSTYIDIKCLINISKILYTLNNLMINGIIEKPLLIQQQIIKLNIPIIYTYVFDLMGCWKMLQRRGYPIDYTNLFNLAKSVGKQDEFIMIQQL